MSSHFLVRYVNILSNRVVFNNKNHGIYYIDNDYYINLLYST